jgi:hypothetical protein
MKVIIACLLAVAMLGGCGIEAAIKRNDDRYMQPGALDAPLTKYYDTYSFKFLDQYRTSHQWPVAGGACEYRSLPTLNRRGDITGYQGDRYMGEIFAVPDVYEQNGKTWQASNTERPPMDFDRFVRSVKYTSKERGREGEVMEIGFKALCGDTWQVTNHSLTLYLHKRDLVGWRAIWTEKGPKGKWSERRIGASVWHVQETAEQDFEPKEVGFGGPFQTWLLPIGDTGYILALKLSANQESLKYPDAHTRFQATFRHLIESVKIETVRP